MYEKIKATAVTIKPKKWDKVFNAEKLESFFVQASHDRPAIILATEGVLEGYVVTDVLENPELGDAMIDIAEPLDGPYVKGFRRLAKTLNTCLCFGFAERIGNEAYNAAIFIDQLGEIRGHYHKTQLAEGTGPAWYYNRIGKAIRAFDTPFGKAGYMICNDRWNPMIARTLVLDGAQFLLIPSYGSKSKGQNQTVLARARENGVPIVESNVGMGLIVSKGEIVAYKWGNDQIVTADIEVPHAVSTNAARKHEQAFMKLRTPEMKRRYRKTRDQLSNGDTDKLSWKFSGTSKGTNP